MPKRATLNPSREVIVIPDSPQKSSGSSSSTSALNLNSWDGLVDEYFGDVLNNNTPLNQNSDKNVDLSFTGEEVPSGPSVATHVSSFPEPPAFSSAS